MVARKTGHSRGDALKDLCMHYSTLCCLDRTPMFDWCVVQWWSKNKLLPPHPKKNQLMFRKTGPHLLDFSNYFTLNNEHKLLGGCIYSMKESTNIHFR